MNKLIKRIAAIFGQFAERVLGLLGGLVFAFAVCLVLLQLFSLTLSQPLLWLAGGLISTMICSCLGLIFPKYFMLFFIPLFMWFANADGCDCGDDGDTLPVFVLCLSLLIAFGLLGIGGLFRIPTLTLIGGVLFCAYAILAPRYFQEKQSP